MIDRAVTGHSFGVDGDSFRMNATMLVALLVIGCAAGCGGEVLLGAEPGPGEGGMADAGADRSTITFEASPESEGGVESAAAGRSDGSDAPTSSVDGPIGDASPASEGGVESAAAGGPDSSVDGPIGEEADGNEGLPPCPCAADAAVNYSPPCTPTATCGCPVCPTVFSGSCCTAAGFYGCSIGIPPGPILSCN